MLGVKKYLDCRFVKLFGVNTSNVEVMWSCYMLLYTYLSSAEVLLVEG